jgi:hypothetical protein
MAKLQIEDQQNTRIAWVYNLSLGGAGLNSTEPIESGQYLAINFRVPGKSIELVGLLLSFRLGVADLLISLLHQIVLVLPQLTVLTAQPRGGRRTLGGFRECVHCAMQYNKLKAIANRLEGTSIVTVNYS